MSFRDYVDELNSDLEKGILPPPYSDIQDRDQDEVTLVLKSLCRFADTYYTQLELFPSLESLFRKHYLGNKQHFFTPSEFLNLAARKEKLFEAKEHSFFVVDDRVNEDSLDAIYEQWLEWIEKAKIDHAASQKQIQEQMSLKLSPGELNCRCQLCIADYRAKLRDLIFDEMTSYIDENLEGLEDKLIDQKIEKTASVYSGIKKHIDKILFQNKRRLKPGSLRRLEKQVKAYVDKLMGPDSELAKIYQERLRIKLNSMLLEAGMKPDLAEEEEIERFFRQMGLGIWKFEKAIEREMEKFINAIMAYKRKDISSQILKDYLGDFWVHSPARKIKRKIIYHMGPTNSGKTYHAIQALAAAEKGCYLAPLRLLAGELYDTLNEKGVKTSLLTGEEVVETPGATHYSSTIEMAKLSEEFNCVVIDEIQMITDDQRGWAWTRALVGMISPEIHVCGDPSVLNLIKEILTLTGDELEVVEYNRMTELKIEKRQIRLTELKKNDALIVFSRKNALKYKADLEALGFKVSIVYGRLSPEVRREQARKFDEGETDIIVSTDAIAMGMNLPVQRIVFTTLSKFFNAQEHFLSHSEIKQIAGRAGRFQRFPVGYVNCLVRVEEGLSRLKDALNSTLEQAKLAMVGPDLDIFGQVNSALHVNGLSTLSLPEFLRLFNTMSFRKPFYCVDLKEMIEVAEMVEAANEGLNSMTDSEIFGFACAPVNLGQMDHVQYFNWIVNNYAHQMPSHNEMIDPASKNIDYLETSIKCVELYQWLSRHFGRKFFDYDENELLENKSEAIEQLNNLLSEKILRSCSSCGVNLPEKHEFNICDVCFSQRRRPRNNFNSKKGFRSSNSDSKGGRGSKSKRSRSGGTNSKRGKRGQKKRR